VYIQGIGKSIIARFRPINVEFDTAVSQELHYIVLLCVHGVLFTIPNMTKLSSLSLGSILSLLTGWLPNLPRITIVIPHGWTSAMVALFHDWRVVVDQDYLPRLIASGYVLYGREHEDHAWFFR
jgi:hypothetical protein